MKWYELSALEVCKQLNADSINGLTGHEATIRITQFGFNKLATHKKEPLIFIFLKQFKSPLIYVLIFASFILSFMGQAVDALVILSVLLLNSAIGAFQEGRARDSLEKLKSLTRHRALVLRDGVEKLISSEELVPGDILILKEGDKITADGRIIWYQGLRVNESVLTGEAFSIEKNSQKIEKENVIVGDLKNMVFSGTSVVSGSAQVIVTETGLNSELGKISKELLETSAVPLPLAKKIAKLTRFIAFAVFIIGFAVFIIGFRNGLSFVEVFGAIIGLSVSIVPEGLPVAVTIVLSRGVWQMAKQRAIVRQMAAVEAMSNANVLLVDKTGTLTTGKMEVDQVYHQGQVYEVTSNGYKPEGEIIGLKHDSKLKQMLELISLSLSAQVIDDQGQGWRAVGDPTEAAIYVLCHKAGIKKEDLEKKYKTLYLNPFDSEKRYIEGQFQKGKEKWKVIVGAPDVISKRFKINDLATKSEDLSNQGKRVVGAAVFGPKNEKQFGSSLFAIDEEVRETVRPSIEQAEKAGFRIVMLTGDFPNTALEVAKKVGIFKPGDKVLSGSDIEKLDDLQLAKQLDGVSVFGRITPDHKLKIVKAFQARGFICAMTGDGVNDSPALQAADLGIGLGSGTQVAKDASDIVLVDDNFETIINAISQGRAIYLTLKKVILYLFSTSLGEVLVIVGGLFLGLPLPLLAVQIIWVNFVTDGFFVVALAADPIHRNLIALRERGGNLMDKLMGARILTMGVSMFVSAMPVFYFYLQTNGLDYARSMVLLVLSATQWFNALNVRSRYKSVFRVPIDNRYLVLSFAAVFVMQYLILQTSFGNKIMHTVPLTSGDWIVGLLVSSLVIWIEELRKIIVRISALIKSSPSR